MQPYDTLGAATVTIPQAAMPTGCGVTVAPPSVSSITYLYALIIRAHTVALHGRINHNCYQLPDADGQHLVRSTFCESFLLLGLAFN